MIGIGAVPPVSGLPLALQARLSLTAYHYRHHHH